MDQKRFLITGGSQGIGAALVTLARKAGHAVVFTGRHDDTIGQVAGETGAFGLRADSSIADDNERTVEVCTQQMGGIDVLVNNAASWYDAAIGELDLDAETLLYEYTVEDPTSCTRPFTVAQPMRKNRAQVFEYACHEGNYGMTNMLTGARVQEKAVEGTARPA